MTKHRFEFEKARKEGKTRAPGTGATNAPEHYWRIAQWAMLKGGQFTARELHERFGICESTCFRYVRAWRNVFGPSGPVIRRATKREIEPAPVPAKLSLADILKR